ncbi:MAG: DUF2179 domain-containing protein [Bacteroidota bacterium]
MPDTFDYYSWVVLPLLIFASRICDVTLGTVRHVFVARGIKNLAPVLGFFEVLIWIVVVKQVMSGAENWACYVAWAGGFACGNYVGLLLEEKLAIGLQVIRIITNQNCDELIAQLRASNHGVTIVEAMGAKGPVKMVFTIIQRKHVDDVAAMIHGLNPGAFYSVEDIRDSSYGVFSRNNRSYFRRVLAGKQEK